MHEDRPLLYTKFTLHPIAIDHNKSREVLEFILSLAKDALNIIKVIGSEEVVVVKNLNYRILEILSVICGELRKAIYLFIRSDR